MIKNLVRYVASTGTTNSYLDLVQSKSNALEIKNSFICSELDKKLGFAMKFNEFYGTNIKFTIYDSSVIPSLLPRVSFYSDRVREIHLWKVNNCNKIVYLGDTIQILASSELMFVKLWNSMMFKMSLPESKRKLYRANAKQLHTKAFLVNGLVNTAYKNIDDFAFLLPFEPFSGSKYQKEFKSELIKIIREVLK